MRKITFLCFIVLLAFMGSIHAQSTINITTSGGSWTGEKWVSITTEINGGGTQIWGQGNGTQCDGAGLINVDIEIDPGTYFVNCYDQYDDGWDGTLITVTAYGDVIGNNGGVSPDDGEDTDSATSCEGTPEELEASFQIIVPEAPSCLMPSGLTASEITTSSAILSWTEEGTASIYNVEVVEAGVTPTENPTDSGVAIGFTKTGLSVYTEYEYYVQADCEDNGTSDWVGPYSFTTLPTPPANDECSDAVSLTVNADYDCTVVTNGTILGATDSGVDNCGGTPDDDVWYSFVATDEVHMVSLINISGSTVDMYHAIYDGSSGCGSLGEPLECNDGDSSELDGLTPGNTYYVQVFTWTSAGGHTSVFDICIGTLPCLEGEATGTIVSDCDNTQFSIDVEVTNQEDITDLTDGTTTIEVTGEGTYTFGPYPSGTEVAIDALHTDEYCDFEVDSFEYNCPPSNDLPGGAIALTLDEGEECGENTITDITNLGATDSGEGAATCGSYNGGDLWFTIVAPAEIITLNVSNLSGLTSVAGAIYSGTPGGFTELDCTAFGSGWPWEISGLSIGETYYLQVFDYDNDQEGTFDLCGYYISCTPAEVIAGVVPNCDSDEFFVEIGIETVDDFGDLVTLTDGAGQSETVNTSQQLYIFGPYANGTEVTITAEHSDPACDFEVGTWEFYCPPANDDCEGAEMLTVGPSVEAYPIDGTVLGATGDSEPNDCGLNGPGVWYAIVVPANGSVNIETATDSNGTTGFDSVIEAFSGSCGSLTSIDCDDDGASSGNYSLLELNDLTPGETIYVRVWEYGGNETEPFSISAYNETLSTQDFDTQELFSYFPNPVENSLTIKAQQSIEMVEVYNMLGQMVANETPNNLEGTIDMSALAAGSYFVKVTIGNSSETIRIVKK
ncbi:T9SS type A sorting domain-containing protein [Mangrovimonas sp. CR14]|uniref:T9SS type A sorting domain-containing protein n=1 Tax=Mangrovimonas sp. CR14 TaxID=2706120 RepID=UPI00141FCFD1|nr:T9SS type A sorting domain-containing protein [Mangrovimonas sp. CR14]NIK92183.1 T9SS type A sorting domain-containing protein [Mangrovimonas sp. CR14]